MRPPVLALGCAALAAVAGCQSHAPAAQGAPAAAPTAEAGRGRLDAADTLGALETPDRAQWQQPDRIMDALDIADGSNVADIGAGGGWFTTYLAHRVGPNGLVYAEDIQPAMLDAITRKLKSEGLDNVTVVLGEPDDPRLPGQVQAALMVDLYPQLRDPVALLRRVAASLAPGGRLGIVDFKADGAGGPGPDLDERVGPDVVIRDARAAGLTLAAQEDFLRYQYFLVFTTRE